MVSTTLLSRQFRERLEANGIPVEAMYLFGSHARGHATAHSDIDVLVVSPMRPSRGFWARCADVAEALGDLAAPVQVYPVTPQEFERPEPGGFIESIRDEIRPLYLRNPRRSSRRKANRAAH